MESRNKHPIPMTSEEQNVLNQFQCLIKSKKLTYNTDLIDDSYLIRFLRARKMDLNKTLEMLIAYINWRSENNIDDIESFQFHELDQIKVYYPHGFHKTDKQGRPIYIDILGDLNIEELFNITSEDRLLKYNVKLYEYLLNRMFPTCSKKSDKCIYQTLTIIDLKFMSSKIMNRRLHGFLKRISANSQNYYPECLGELYVVNTGFLFKATWSIVKVFIDEKTKNKITTLGSDYKSKLLEIVDKANLPEFLGGDCKCEPKGCLLSNAGPWNEVNKDVIKVKCDVEDKQVCMKKLEKLSIRQNCILNNPDDEGIVPISTKEVLDY